jgi:hypothetical protein
MRIVLLIITVGSDIRVKLRSDKRVIDTRRYPAERGRRPERPADQEHKSCRTQKGPLSEQQTMAAEALQQSAYAASGSRQQRRPHVRDEARIRGQLPQAAATHPLQEGPIRQPRGRPEKALPGLQVAALNEPVFVTTNGRRRKITKREAVIHQVVNKSQVPI